MQTLTPEKSILQNRYCMIDTSYSRRAKGNGLFRDALQKPDARPTSSERRLQMIVQYELVLYGFQPVGEVVLQQPLQDLFCFHLQHRRFLDSFRAGAGDLHLDDSRQKVLCAAQGLFWPLVASSSL